jgi:hypothetical protein
MIDKAYVISFMCNLSSEVGREVFSNKVPHDCFCQHGGAPDDEFLMSREVLDFISDAVHEKMSKWKGE